MNEERKAQAPDYVAPHALLTDKVVVVTAAAGAGIGAATARRALEEGARAVVLGDVHDRRLATLDAELGEEFGADRVRSVLCDVTNEEQVQALCDAADEVGGVAVLVNNAALGATVSVVDITDEEWDRIIGVTLGGTFRCLRAAVKRMITAGKRGVVVNTSSILAWNATAGQAAYGAAKGGVNALTRNAAMDVAQYGIRINCVSPSFAMNPFLAKVSSEEYLREWQQGEAFGRSAEPWEIANVTVFLASDYSTYMTGEVVSVSSHHA